jgi:hypothetical protein
MNYLKLTSKGFHNYNGQLNILTFKDGISTEPVPPRIADRIAASVACVACDAEGNTSDTPVSIGIQHRLIAESASRAAVSRGLARQTDADRVMEEKVDLSKALKAPSDVLYTKPQLEEIADKGGITALREIGKQWSVKGRAIPEVIEKILVAQTKFIAQRNAALENKTATKNRVTVREADVQVEVVKEEVPEVAGIEGLAAEFAIDGTVVVTGAQLIERAHKNSGKSLTGWNALNDKERQPYVDREIQALEIFHSARLVAVVEAPVVPEEPVDPVEGDPAYEAWFGAKVQEALDSWEPKITHEDAIALVRANLAEKLAAKEA